MPPKRAAPSSSTNAAKKSKKSATADSDASDIPRSKRWAKVSGSANADMAYKLAMRDPAVAYAYICMCPPSWDGEEDDEEDEEDEPGDDEGAGCGKAACRCTKPIDDYPDHTWVITSAGYRKYFTQHILASLRTPDYFDMYTFNDHTGYGALEVLQNLILDFVEATGNWKEQWAVCEALPLFLLGSDGQNVAMIDDGEGFDHAVRIVGRMFLAMLAQLERDNLLKEDSEIRDLGVVMALYIKLASSMRGNGALEDESEEEGVDDEKFDHYVQAYAKKHSITLKGPTDIDDLVGELHDSVKLPPKGKELWGGFAAAFKDYQKHRSMSHQGSKKAAIGGDALDITTWTSAERKAASFNKKDPLGKKELDAIKEGMVLQIA